MKSRFFIVRKKNNVKPEIFENQQWRCFFFTEVVVYERSIKQKCGRPTPLYKWLITRSRTASVSSRFKFRAYSLGTQNRVGYFYTSRFLKSAIISEWRCVIIFDIWKTHFYYLKFWIYWILFTYIRKYYRNLEDFSTLKIRIRKQNYVHN